MANISPLDRAQSVVDDKGRLTERMQIWTDSVSRLPILEGTGSPEGAIEARTTRQYMDTTGGAGAVLYIKQVNDIGGDRKLGWVVV